MIPKRFSKLLLGVLALALWAGSAYGQTGYFTETGGPFNLTYIQGSGSSQTAATVTISITNGDGSGHTLTAITSGPFDIDSACTTGVSLATLTGTTCTFKVDSTVADAGPTSSNQGLQITLYADGAIDSSITLNTTILPAMISNKTSVSLTYQVGMETTVQQTANISSSGVQENYTYPHAGCSSAFISVSASTGQTPDVLTVKIIDAGADTNGPVTGSCTVSLTDSSTFVFQSLTVNYTITAAPTWTSSSTTIDLGNYKQNSSQSVSQHYTPLASADGFGFTTGASSTGNWLKVLPASGTASIASGTQLTISVDDTAADAIGTTGQKTGSITITPAGGTPLTFNVTVTLQGQNTIAVSPSTITFANNYVTGTETVQTLNITPTANYASTAYTVSLGGATWLSVAAGPYSANTDSSGTQLVFSVVPAVADTLSSNQTATVVLTPTAGGAPTNLTVKLNITVPTFTSTPPSPVALTELTTSAHTIAGTNIANLTASAAGVGYTTHSTAAWLTIAPATGTAGATGIPLTYTVDNTNVAITALTLGQSASGTIQFSVLNAASSSLTVTVTVTAVAPSTITVSPNPVTFATTYLRASGVAPTAVPLTVSDTNSGTDTYTVATGLPSWLTCTAHNPSVGNGVTDTLTCSVNTGPADLLNAGVQTATVHVQVSGMADTLIPVSLTTNSAASPLTAPAVVNLYYIIGGTTGQNASATTSSNITSTDTSSDTYTITGITSATWLSAVATHGSAKTGGGNGDTITWSLVSAHVPSAPGTTTTTANLHIDAYNPDRAIQINMIVQQQPLIVAPNSLTMSYAKNSGAPTNPAVQPTISVLAGNNSTGFLVDPQTVPVWLSVTPLTGTATSGGVPMTLTVNTTAAAGLSTGNYTASVGLATSTSFVPANETKIAIAFTISNAAPSISLTEGAGGITNINKYWAPGNSIPTPTWTVVSSNEPIPFTAVCTVVPSDTTYAGSAPCTIPTSGVAYTWGNQIVAVLDPNLFNGETLGNTVSVNVKITPQGGQALPAPGYLTLTYFYTLQPQSPGALTLMPTSAAPITTGSLVVTISGSNFVSPANIVGSTIKPTYVFIGATTLLPTANYVVLSPSEIMATIPAADFPTTLTAGKATMAIGVANMISGAIPSGPSVTTNLTVTTAPVIYAMTNTASFVQPNPGNSPVAAPYELMSIFGDNFGPISPAAVSATQTAAGQIPTGLVYSPAGAAKPLSLSVAFKGTATGAKSYNAPILFANEYQINLAVPSTVAMGNNTVIITAGASTNVSDGKFTVTGVAADAAVFTLASDGIGQGAIVNSDGTVNRTGFGQSVSNNGNGNAWVSIYMTGLGTPESTALDVNPIAGSAPTNCVAITGTKAAPGYLQIANTSGAYTGYTAPPTAWTTLDGAVINPNLIMKGGAPPCMTDSITVTFGSGANAVTASGAQILYAGWGNDEVAGLYQLNVLLPANTPIGTIPVVVTFGSNAPSPAVQMVTIQ